MSLKIEYQKQAEKFFARHEDIREEFISCVTQLIENDHPERVNFKNLHGKLKGYSRIAIGSYRVIYTVRNGEVVIVNVISAGSRGDIYKHL